MRGWWRWARVTAGVGLLVVVVAELGTSPFLRGLRSVDLASLVAALAIGAVVTGSSAWRWTVVARRLGAHLPWGAAVAAYYRSQFLNCVLPGGVLGDVHRGVRHGRQMSDVGRGLRAVAWERISGQTVQALATLMVLAAVPSPLQEASRWIALALATLAVAVAAVLIVPHRSGSRPGRWLATAASDIRTGLLARRAWPPIVLASSLAVAGFCAMFLIAADRASSGAVSAATLPISMIVLAAMAVPANVGGWGPREGVAGWAFGVTGLGAANGVATATAYGVLCLASVAPGCAVLLTTARRNETGRPVPASAGTGAHG